MGVYMFPLTYILEHESTVLGVTLDKTGSEGKKKKKTLFVIGSIGHME